MQFQPFLILLQWPTLLTLIMFPLLVVVSVRLVRREEEMAMKEFGEEYRAYRKQVAGFIPECFAKPMLIPGGNEACRLTPMAGRICVQKTWKKR